MKLIIGLLKRPPSMKWIQALASAGHELRAVWGAGSEDSTFSEALTRAGIKIWSSDPFAADHEGTDHISLARWAEAFVIPHADAGFLARYAHGHADDFLTLQLMAATNRVVVMPDIPEKVWQHPAVRDNTAALVERGVHVAPNRPGLETETALALMALGQ